MNQEKVKTDQITDHITGKPGEDVLEPRSASGTGAQPISSGRRKFFRQVGTTSLGITAGMAGMHRLVSAASEHALGDISGLGGEHESGDSLVLRERFGRNGEGLNLDRVNGEQILAIFQRINTLDRMFLDWKKRHFGIANHMIGSDTGTRGSDVIEYLGRFKGELYFPELEGVEPTGSGRLYPLIEPMMCPRGGFKLFKRRF
jgi:hypothetical protein